MPKEKTLHRKLAAIVAADVVGYSRMMEVAEVATLRRIKTAQKSCIMPVLATCHGRLIKTTGDGFLFEFASAVDATIFALSFQKRVQAEMEPLPPEQRLVFRVGVHAGDILSDGADMFGDGVNVASRLETLCTPGGICLSSVVQQQLHGKLDLPLVDLGQHQVKNITRAIHVFGIDAVGIGGVEPGTPPLSAGASRRPLWVAIAACAVLLTLGGVAVVALRPGGLSTSATLAPPGRDFSIAVLPFSTLGGDGKPDAFADALVDNLTTDLAIGFPASSVIASSSAFSYRDKPIDPRAVGAELGARYLLEGSVQRLSDTMRVNVRLVEAASGSQLWSDHFERPVAEIGTVQDEITTGIANALSVQLVRAEADRRKLAANPTALDLVFRASALTMRDDSDDAYGRAEAMLRKALALDPDNSMAAKGLSGLLLSNVGRQLLRRDDTYHATLDEAGRLLSGIRKADPRQPGLNGLLAFQAVLLDKPNEALDYYQNEIDIDPSAASAYAGEGICLIKLGRAAEAVPLIQKAIRLDPRSPGIFANEQALMLAYFALGKYGEAIAVGERAHDAAPDNADILLYLASAEALNGDDVAARSRLTEALKADPDRRLGPMRQAITVSEPANVALVRNYLEGLQRAGLRE